MTYIVIAQSYTTSQRIKREVDAASETEVLYLVAAKLDDAGFYPLSIKLRG